MARGAGCRGGRHVRAHESETGNAVIERSGVPALGGVAAGAIRSGEGSSGSGVDRRGGLLPGGVMAAGISAIRGSNLQIVIVVDVARSAGKVGVAIGERESGGAVIKDRGGPVNGVVAPGAISSCKGWASGSVRRIIGLLPLG